MNVPCDDPASRLRWGVYGILIAVSAGGMVGRILSVNAVDRLRLEQHLKAEHEKKGNRPDWQQQRPFLSANDRSRWCTIRALVERGTYSIDEIQAEPNWDTIDMVRHNGRLYSSKPPLLVTLLAGEYWLIHKATGWTLGDHPFEIGRFMLITVNVLPLMLAFVVLARLVERFGVNDWGRIFVMAVATLATFLSTFAVTLNNHSVAAISALFAVAAAVPALCDGGRQGWRIAAAGFFAAFAAANELPALSLLGLLGLALLWKAPRQTLMCGLPAAAVVAAAFLGTNYASHGQWRVPYAQRRDGPTLFAVADLSVEALEELDRGAFPASMRKEFDQHGRPLAGEVDVEKTIPGQRWIVSDNDHDDSRRFALQLVVDAGAGNPSGGELNTAQGWGLKLRIEVRSWGNWYDFSYERGGKRRDSYWRSDAGRSLVDRGEPSRAAYLLNVLIGHHGIYSLTPVWLLTVIGLARSMRRRDDAFRLPAAIIAAASLACLAFYLSEGQENRNYGGTTSGLRWMFWFAPLWALGMLPALERADSSRWRRIACLLLLGFSVLSVSYPTWNPWTHPWLVQVSNYLGWTKL